MRQHLGIRHFIRRSRYMLSPSVRVPETEHCPDSDRQINHAARHQLEVSKRRSALHAQHCHSKQHAGQFFPCVYRAQMWSGVCTQRASSCPAGAGPGSASAPRTTVRSEANAAGRICVGCVCVVATYFTSEHFMQASTRSPSRPTRSCLLQGADALARAMFVGPRS